MFIVGDIVSPVHDDRSKKSSTPGVSFTLIGSYVPVLSLRLSLRKIRRSCTTVYWISSQTEVDKSLTV